MSETMGSLDEMDYAPEDVAFLAAIEDFKAKHGKKFPTWTEVLSIVKGLGYERTA